MSEYKKLLGEVDDDPRVLAAAAQNPEVAAMLGLGTYFPTNRLKQNRYDARLEQVGGDPRTLAAAAQNPEVAAMLGLSL